MSDLVVAPYYEGLSAVQVRRVQDATREIHVSGRIAARAMVAAGKRLKDIRDILIQTGQWRRWLELEFGGSHDTADRLIRVADKFGSVDAITSFKKGALYFLSQETVPQAAREQAVELAQSGQTITRQVAEQIVSTFQKAAAKVIAENATSGGFVAINGYSLPLTAETTIEVQTDEGMSVSQDIPLSPQSQQIVETALINEVAETLHRQQQHIIDSIVKRGEKLGKVEVAYSRDLCEIQALVESLSDPDLRDAMCLEGGSICFALNIWALPEEVS